MQKLKFSNAQEAFECYSKEILFYGKNKSNNRYLSNVGFYILNPIDRQINTPWRKWSKSYADREFDWYLSGNPSVSELKKYAPIWDKMHGGDNIVNSNYGYQWNRGSQMRYIIDELKRNNESRRAVISIYDGKENHLYKYDTPCTLDLQFTIEEGKLNMTVIMRSNDLWFGFCNDQFCFSNLQTMIAEKLSIEIGWYYHFAVDLHLYNEQLKIVQNIFYK